MLSACTAAAKSCPATTKPKLSAEAPCDTMRTLMPPSALKIRAATPGGMADVLAHHANDSLILIHPNIGELAQLGQDFLQTPGLIYG